MCRTLSNTYYREFYSEACVILAYLKPWHIQNPRKKIIHFSTPPTLRSLHTLVRYPRQHATHIRRHERWHATHTTHFATPPTQARHPHQHVNHARTPPTLARHPRKHEQYAISQTPINGILCTITHSYLRRESAWSVAICL